MSTRFSQRGFTPLESSPRYSSISQKLLSSNPLTGFTLIEMILVIALISVVGVVTTVVDTSVVSTLRIHRDAESVLALVRDAQSDAVYGLYDFTTGVHIDTDTATAFVGTTFDTRDSDFDRAITISTALANELPLDIQFESHSGDTQERMEILFTHNSVERVLVVETSGLAYLTP